MNTQQIAAIRLASDCILEAANQAGPMGAPSGVVYAALMVHGMKLATYESLLGALERMGKIIVEHDCIRPVKAV